MIILILDLAFEKSRNKMKECTATCETVLLVQKNQDKTNLKQRNILNEKQE